MQEAEFKKGCLEPLSSALSSRLQRPVGQKSNPAAGRMPLLKKKACSPKTKEQLLAENDELRARLAEAEDTLSAIRSGEVDALVVSGTSGDRVFTLKGAEHPYRVLIEEMNEGAATLDRAGSILYCNHALASMLGIPLEKVIGSSLKDFIAPESLPAFNAICKQSFRSAGKGEVLLKRKNRAALPIQLSGRRLQIDDVPGTGIVLTELTLQKKAEEVLRNSRDELEIKVNERTVELRTHQIELEMQNEELRRAQGEIESSRHRYSDLYDFAPTGYFTFDQDGKVFEANLTGIKLLGVGRESLFNKPFTLFIADSSSRELFHVHRMAALKNRSRKGIELKLRKEDGTEFYAQLDSIAVVDTESGAVYCRTAINDVSERKRAEEAIRRSSRLLDAVVNNTHLLMACFDSNFNFVWVNRAYAKADGKDPAFFPGKHHFDLYPNEENQSIFRTVVETGKPFFIQAKPFEYKDQPERGVTYWDWGLIPVVNSSGKVDLLVMTLLNITDRKRTEDKIQESEARLRKVLESITDGYYVLDSDWRFVDLNPVAEKHFGRNAESLLGKNIWRETNKATHSVIYRRFHQAVIEKRPVHFEAESEIRPGFWSELHVYPRDGAIEIYFRDITDRKRSELKIDRLNQELQRRISELETIFNTVPIGLSICDDPRGLHIRGNPAIERMMGVAEGNELSKGAPDSPGFRVFQNGRELEIRELPVQRAVRGEVVTGQIIDVMREDGRTITAHCSATPLFDEQGRPRGSVGAFLDITDLKRVEEARRASEEKYRSLFENMIDGFALHKMVLDEHGKPIDYIFVEANAAFENFTGLRTREIIGRPATEVIPGIENDPADWIGTYGDVALTGKEFRFEQYAEPLARWYAVSAYSPGKGYFATVFEDITQRKQTEEALRNLNEDLENRVMERTSELRKTFELIDTVFSSINIHLAYMDNDFNFIRVNRAYADAEGRDPEFYIGKNYFELYPQDRNQAIFNRVVETGKPYFVYEKTFDSPDHAEGETTYWDWSLQPVKAFDGQVAGVVMSLTNVTDRKRAETDRMRLAAAVESNADAIVITDTRGVIQYVNPSFERITGYPLTEVAGQSLHILDSGNHDQEFYRTLREALVRHGVWRGHLVQKRKDGSLYHEDCTYSPVKNAAGEVINYVSIKRDITEKLRLESIAEAVNTMENIGYIFSGVRHEIGNPINAINMLLGILKSKLNGFSKDNIRSYVERITVQVGRVEYLLRSLKSFNMYERLEPSCLEIPSFIRKLLPLVRKDFRKKGISIKTSVERDAKEVYADPRALQQVMLNILTNASDAVSNREDPQISIHVSRAGNMVRIRVEDNGSGMNAEKLKDLFKPFHTTKAGGTGLGLVIVKKMLTKMNGTIEITSRLNEGTIVDIYLPDGKEASQT